MYEFLGGSVYTSNQTINLEQTYFDVNIHDNIYAEKHITKCSHNMTLTLKFLQAIHVHKQSCHRLKQGR